MIKREKGQMPEHQHDTLASDPGILEESISVRKGKHRKIEKFMKDVLISHHYKKKEASFDVLSMEDFTPSAQPCCIMESYSESSCQKRQEEEGQL